MHKVAVIITRGPFAPDGDMQKDIQAWLDKRPGIQVIHVSHLFIYMGEKYHTSIRTTIIYKEVE